MVCIFGCREDEPEFPFPKYERNPAMFMAWVQVLKGCINNKNLKNIKTYEDLRLCGKHFNTKDRVIINNVHHLLHTATPQHFLFRKLYSSEDRIIPQPKVSVPVNIDKIGSNLVLKNGSNAATKVNENGIVHLDPKDLEAGVYLKVDAPALPKQEKSSDPKPQAEGKTFRITSVEALRKMLKENVQGPVGGITIKKFPTEEVPIDAINTDSTELADPLFIDLKKSTPAKPQVEHNPSPQDDKQVDGPPDVKRLPPPIDTCNNKGKSLDIPGARIINDDLMTTPSISNNKLYLKSLVTYGKPSSRNSKPVIVSNQIIKQANTKIHVLPLQQNHGAGVRVVPPQDGNTQNQDHHYFKKPVRLDESSLTKRRPLLGISLLKGSPNRSVLRCPHPSASRDPHQIVGSPCGRPTNAASPDVPLPTNVVYTPYKQPKRVTVFPPPPPNISNPAGAKADVQSRIVFSAAVKTYKTSLKEFHGLKRKYLQLKKNNERLRKEIKNRKHAKLALRKVLDNLTPAAKMFTIMQMTQNRNGHGRRFNNFEKMFALALLETNLTAYKLVANYFAMPTVTTLRKEGTKHESNSPQFYEEMFKMELEKEPWEEVFVDKPVGTQVQEQGVTDVANQEQTQVLNEEQSEVHNQEQPEVINQEQSEVLNQDETKVLNQEETEVLNQEGTEVLNQEPSEILNQEETNVVYQEDNGMVYQEDTEMVYQEDTEMVYQEDTEMVYQEHAEEGFKNVVTEVLYQDEAGVVYQAYTDAFNQNGAGVVYQQDKEVVNQEGTEVVYQDDVEVVNQEGTELVYQEDTEVVNQEETEVFYQEGTEAGNQENTEVFYQEGTDAVNQEDTELFYQEGTEAVNQEGTELVYQEDTEVVNQEETEVFYQEGTEAVNQEDTEIYYQEGTEAVNQEDTEVFYQEGSEEVNQEYTEVVNQEETDLVYQEEMEMVNQEQDVARRETETNKQKEEVQWTIVANDNGWQVDSYKVQSGPNTFVVVEPGDSLDVDDINRDMTPKELFGLHSFDLST